ncbi:glyoxylate reductase/hydroxypyruvate reductase-like isoform X2 [Adelges cooleyi]|nr:glyoxylate reductase/hydroxypyruvate reductase-like isoform X2 [Adelges cooleyi]XP_050443250.1 glyoxylate reductase/hydroxypyruvate reductase-like isoform X2 [Adelges cooleyi]XP_050443253.1 glyoxylate reductase/hydroxypyruvate reductase-like isoform X2 [Adelges cooleyi]
MSSKPKVLLTHKAFPQTAIDMLSEKFDVELCNSKSAQITQQDVIDNIPGKFGIFCCPPIKINEEVLKTAGPSLKVVGTMSVGYDHVDLNALKKYGVRLGNTPDVLTEAVAEIAVGLLIATTRRFFEANKALKTGGWTNYSPDWMCGRGIQDSVVGIIGCGNIGTSIAEKLNKFNIAELLYTSRSEKPAVKAIGGKLVAVDDLVKRSDFIVLSVALTPETRFIINKDRIANMKSNAVLVNIGRGDLVDQDALIEALKGNKIRGAGLDVMTPEPLPLDNPLMNMDNVVLLPHIGSATVETRREMAELTSKNIIAVLENCVMPSEVKI